MTAFIITAWITILASTMASLRNWKMITSPNFIRLAFGAEDVLGPLCDLQAITGAAIVIAGFSQWQTITYYHRELVGSYWYLTSNSFWSARRAYMYDAIESTKTPGSGPLIRRTPTSGTSTGMASTGATEISETTTERAKANKDWTVWRVCTRRVFIVISVALGIAWSTSSTILEIHGWDERDPSRCYNYNDATYNNQGKYYNGVILVGLFVYFVSLLWSFVDRDRKAERKYHGLFKPEENQREGNLSNSRWNTWDIIMLKVLNEHLVNNETKIGFGQVLPLVLLAQIGLNIVDIWKDPSKAIERQNDFVRVEGWSMSRRVAWMLLHAFVAVERQIAEKQRVLILPKVSYKRGKLGSRTEPERAI
ncbi:hypothetical protein BKA61DRAFT_575334 [Leptodontidium sp. MPI-SDFR-AT-0119]|nr:hypothetical protein BKA61DRAFT_575334 [Leptodontidium sp. MPI-SDFR-AT-0119]